MSTASVTIEGNEVVVRLPLKPHTSKSGRAILLTPDGWQETADIYQGAPISVSASVCVRTKEVKI